MNKYRFFVVIPPGFEEVCFRELISLLPSLTSDLIEPPENWLEFPGGIELKCDLSFGLSLNRTLKSATRILMRLGSYQCESYDELLRILDQIQWSNFSLKKNIKFNINSRSSRLNHQREIEKQCIQFFKKKKRSPGEMRLDLRFFRDELSLSIDTTGEPLHKRGWRHYTPNAPIRENLASALLISLINGIEPHELSEMTLCDPYMGSGSFLFESSLLNRPSKLRSFSFESWDLAKKLDWFQGTLAWPSFGSYFGCEKDRETFNLLEKNFDPTVFDAEKFEFFNGDNRNAKVDQYRGRCFLISNLPYGARLNKDSRLHPEKVLEDLIDQYSPKRVGLLWSIKHQAPINRIPNNWLRLNSILFENGGIPVRFDIFARKNILTDIPELRV